MHSHLYINVANFNKEIFNMRSTVFFLLGFTQVGIFSQVPSNDNRIQEVREITVGTGNQDALAKLLMSCKREDSDNTLPSNAYFELRSFIDGEQLELVEAYYLLQLGVYGSKKGTLKTGRFALLAKHNRYFSSQSTAASFLDFQLQNPLNAFAYTPFNVGRRPQKYFRFWLADSMVFAAEDTLLELRFAPRKRDGSSFSGTVWVNPKEHIVRQLELVCTACKQYPFLPIFHTDSLSSADLKLRFSFQNTSIGPVLSQLQANYSFHYASRTHDIANLEYIVRTEAKLQAFQSEQLFSAPNMIFQKGVNDYRQMLAYPYSRVFWQTNLQPVPVAAIKARNQLFYNQAILTSQQIVTHEIAANRLFEHPFVQWSSHRVLIREALPNPIGQQFPISDISSLYKLKVQLFVDLLPVADTFELLSACVLDPYETFYKLPVDKFVNCFINMYFDLCEISRRQFIESCRAQILNHQLLSSLYLANQKQLEVRLNEFTSEVDRGQNRKAMLKWNAFIVERLGIDNVALFSLYE